MKHIGFRPQKEVPSQYSGDDGHHSRKVCSPRRSHLVSPPPPIAKPAAATRTEGRMEAPEAQHRDLGHAHGSPPQRTRGGLRPHGLRSVPPPVTPR
jgi:hypothetical protein